VSEKDISFGINEELKRAYKVGVKDGSSGIRNMLLEKLDAGIKDCESAIRDGLGNADYWIVRKKTLEEVRRWLDGSNM